MRWLVRSALFVAAVGWAGAALRCAAVDGIAAPVLAPHAAASGTAELGFTRHAAQSLDLAETVPLRWSGGDDALCHAVQSVRFTVGPAGGRFREISAWPTLQLEMKLGARPRNLGSAAPLSLVLYDENAFPLHVFELPLAAFDSLDRPAQGFLQRIAEHSRLWLAPDANDLPEVTYAFHLGDKIETHSTRDTSQKDYLRGVTMTLALDALLAEPERYRMPLWFEGKMAGRSVEVAVISGPRFGLVFGRGIRSSWRGYTTWVDDLALLVVDKETGRPLLERYRETEVRFLDYEEPQPGQFVPMRIILKHEKSSDMEFRFQVLDGRMWLFDAAPGDDGEKVAAIDDVLVDGRPPTHVVRCTTPARQRIELFDWNAIEQRTTRAARRHSSKRSPAARRRSTVSNTRPCTALSCSMSTPSTSMLEDRPSSNTPRRGR